MSTRSVPGKDLSLLCVADSKETHYLRSDSTLIYSALQSHIPSIPDRLPVISWVMCLLGCRTALV